MKITEITLQTKRAFSKALKELLRKKPLDKVTVMQLLTLTNRIRPTFYYHFEDIPDLVKWTIKKEHLHVKAEDRKFIAQISTGGFTEIVLDWLGNGQKESPEQIRKEFCRTQENIIVHSLRMADKNRTLFSE